MSLNYKRPKHTDLMLQAAVLSFCVLPNDDHIYVFVAGQDTRKRLTVHDIGIQV